MNGRIETEQLKIYLLGVLCVPSINDVWTFPDLFKNNTNYQWLKFHLTISCNSIVLYSYVKAASNPI